MMSKKYGITGTKRNRVNGMLYSFENKSILMIAIVFFIGMNIVSNIRKQASFSLIATLFALGSLYVHVKQRKILADAYMLNMIVDMTFLGVSMVNMMIIDEIEKRRAIIKNVFGNRYQKVKKEVKE